MDRQVINNFKARILDEETARRAKLLEELVAEKRAIFRQAAYIMAAMGMTMVFFVAYLMGSSAAKAPIIPIASAGVIVFGGGVAALHNALRRLFDAGERHGRQLMLGSTSPTQLHDRLEAYLQAIPAMRLIYELYFSLPIVARNKQDKIHLETCFLDWMALHLLSPDSNLIDWIIAQRTGAKWEGVLHGFLDDHDPMLGEDKSYREAVIRVVLWKLKLKHNLPFTPEFHRYAVATLLKVLETNCFNLQDVALNLRPLGRPDSKDSVPAEQVGASATPAETSV